MAPVKSVVIFLAFILSSFAWAAPKWTVDLGKGEGEVQFHAVGNPNFIKINGKGSAPTGTLTWSEGKVTGAAFFDLKTLDTGISKRNEHMREKYLEVDKFPQAKLAISTFDFDSPPPVGDFSDAHAKFHGDLTLHGTTQPVNGEAKVKLAGDKLTVDAHFETVITSYKIAVPSFSGITVADKVTVDVNFSTPVAKK